MSEARGIVDLPPEQLAQFQQYVRFVSCNAEQNRQRFYLLTWQRSLHGELVLVCSWVGWVHSAAHRLFTSPKTLPLPRGFNA